MREGDRYQYDARLAVLLLGWSWFFDPQWGWVGLYPPDSPEWRRWNFPKDAQPVDDAAERKLMPAWDVGGYHVADGPEQMGVPRFASDWRAMAMLLAAMRQRGFAWHGVNTASPTHPARATFTLRSNEWSAEAETLPRATAVAALAALTEAGMPGEVSDQTLRGLLTSIRCVALDEPDDFYQGWLELHNQQPTNDAALRFVAAWASRALEEVA
ncbi:MAG: hypothetical protein H6662_15445 [Ardenticatenaceae bacterium]|nr:hypothetical protein [Anaerolineales bacterium]MCB8922981.1 hypothetical protein [Ardenticatenaceae bacterium]MCB8990286.1 hypothetical protein [Ardenticatenaceae bacterium]